MAHCIGPLHCVTSSFISDFAVGLRSEQIERIPYFCSCLFIYVCVEKNESTYTFLQSIYPLYIYIIFMNVSVFVCEVCSTPIVYNILIYIICNTFLFNKIM